MLMMSRVHASPAETRQPAAPDFIAGAASCFMVRSPSMRSPIDEIHPYRDHHVVVPFAPTLRGEPSPSNQSLLPDGSDCFANACNVLCAGVFYPARLAPDGYAVSRQHIADAGDWCVHLSAPFVALPNDGAVPPRPAICMMGRVCGRPQIPTVTVFRLYVLAQGEYAWSGEDSNLPETPNIVGPPRWWRTRLRVRQGAVIKKAAPSAAPRERYAGRRLADRRPGVPRSNTA